jgi:hypothetical protein
MSKPEGLPYRHKEHLPEYDVSHIVQDLFSRARARDEFEYSCALLRLRGMESPGSDPLRESLALMDQMARLLQAPLEGGLQIRLALFLYCHIVEMHDVYHVLGNMMRVALGERYSMNCFNGGLHPSRTDAKSRDAKISCMREWSAELVSCAAGEMLSDMWLGGVRNAFFHSAYSLHEDSFIIRRGKGVLIGNMMHHKVDLTWLVPRIQLGINVGLNLLRCVDDGIRSYKENKIVMGRLADPDLPIPIELTADPEFGLTGFRSRVVSTPEPA